MSNFGHNEANCFIIISQQWRPKDKVTCSTDTELPQQTNSTVSQQNCTVPLQHDSLEGSNTCTSFDSVTENVNVHNTFFILNEISDQPEDTTCDKPPTVTGQVSFGC